MSKTLENKIWKKKKVCHVNGYLTFQRDLLNFSLSQNFQDDLTCIFIVLSLMVRLGAKKPSPGNPQYGPEVILCWGPASGPDHLSWQICSLAAFFRLQQGVSLCLQGLEHSKCSINVLGMKEPSGQWKCHHLIYSVSRWIQLLKDIPNLRRVDEDVYFDSVHSHSKSGQDGDFNTPKSHPYFF